MDDSFRQKRPGAPRGRMFQHGDFESDLLAGQRIQSALEIQSEETRETILLLIQGDGSHWNQFFLDAGLVFWEEWPREEVEHDPEETSDIGVHWNLHGLELGTVLAFPAAPDGCPGLHIHLSDGTKLMLMPQDPADIDSTTVLARERGDVADTYRQLLRVHDHADCFQWPPRFDWKETTSRARTCCDAIEKALGREVAIDDQVQDASFLLDCVVRSTKVGSVVHQQSVRFSNFGDMVTVTDETIDADDLARIREVLRFHDYIYVPREILERPYDGVLVGAEDIYSWWIRYFDYL